PARPARTRPGAGARGGCRTVAAAGAGAACSCSRAVARGAGAAVRAGGRHHGPPAGPGRGVAAPARRAREDALLEEGALALAQTEGREAGTRAEGKGSSILVEGAVARAQAGGGCH